MSMLEYLDQLFHDNLLYSRTPATIDLEIDSLSKTLNKLHIKDPKDLYKLTSLILYQSDPSRFYLTMNKNDVSQSIDITLMNMKGDCEDIARVVAGFFALNKQIAKIYVFKTIGIWHAVGGGKWKDNNWYIVDGSNVFYSENEDDTIKRVIEQYRTVQAGEIVYKFTFNFYDQNGNIIPVDKRIQYTNDNGLNPKGITVNAELHEISAMLGYIKQMLKMTTYMPPETQFNLFIGGAVLVLSILIIGKLMEG